MTRRSGLSWIALRMRRSHPYDPRSDAGLMRALRVTGGAWREQLPERPGPVSRRGKAPLKTPSGGPVLVVGATRYQPRASSVRQLAGGVELPESGSRRMLRAAAGSLALHRGTRRRRAATRSARSARGSSSPSGSRGAAPSCATAA